MSRVERRNLRNGLLFAAPWLMGLGAFLIYPVVSSLYLSFCDYSTLQPPVWIGWRNYQDLAADAVFCKSLANTFVFAALSLPTGMAMALLLALLLNSSVRGLAVFRTIFYLPSLVPVVASAMLWLWVFNGQFGILNHVLDHVLAPLSDVLTSVLVLFGGEGQVRLQPPTWLGDPDWSKPALAIMAVWSMGGTMLIYLAGLQDVPAELYEAAEIDGAGWWRKLLHVTLPCLSPVIYFTFIIGLIGAVQFFTAAYIMGGGPSGGSAGNPDRSTLFYSLYLWAQSFEWLHMGYACAMAWIMLAMVVSLTLIAHRSTRKYVTYAG